MRATLTSTLTLLICTSCVIAQTTAPTTQPPLPYTKQIEKLARDAQTTLAGGKPISDNWRLILKLQFIYEQAKRIAAAQGHESNIDIETAYNPEPEVHPDRLAQVRNTVQATITTLSRAGMESVLEQFADAPFAVRPYNLAPGQTMLDILLPELSDIHDLSQLLRARMYFAAQAGDWKTYATAVRHNLLLARFCRIQASMMHRSAGAKVLNLTCNAVRQDLTTYAAPQTTLTELESLLAEWGESSIPITVSIQAEQLFTYDMVDKCFGNNAMAPGISVYSQLKSLAHINQVEIKPILVKSDELTALRKTFDAGLETVKAPYPLRAATAAGSLDKQNALANQGYISRLLTSSFTRYANGEDIALLQVRGTRVYLLIEIHHLATGTYPKEIPPAAKLLIDPFTTQPLLYSLTVTGYTLYSPGTDMTDNQATPSQKPDDALNIDKPAGTDFILAKRP